MEKKPKSWEKAGSEREAQGFEGAPFDGAGAGAQSLNAPAATAPHRLCVAPMMAWTDRHCRAFHRLLAPHARLYTEMAGAEAVLRGGAERTLAFDAEQRPLAAQFGGSEPQALGRCAALAARRGFDEVNLNVGCPSGRVQRGAFGACLMLRPRRVAAAIAAMREAGPLPVTVKCRLGVDGHDEYGFLRDFAGHCADAGATALIVHARIAVLDGLTPAQNRSVPPVDYERVRRLKREMPLLTIVLNGELTATAQVLGALQWADGVMLGRAAYRNPFWLAELEHTLFRAPLPGGPHDVLNQYLHYVERALREGAQLRHVTRHLCGLFNGTPGARAFRRRLTEAGRRPGAGPEVLEEAAKLVSRAVA